jgi:hypothetical protein
MLALMFDHPARIFRRQRADLVQRIQFIVAKTDCRGSKVVVELIHAPGADNDAGDRWLI